MRIIRMSGRHLAPFVGKSTVDTLILHMEKPAPTLKEASLGQRISRRTMEEYVRKLLSKDSLATATRPPTKQNDALALAIQLDDKQANEEAPDKSDKIISRTTIILVCLAVLGSVSIITFMTMQGEKFARDSKPIIKEDKIEIEKTWLTVADRAIYDGKQEGPTTLWTVMKMKERRG